MKNNKFISFCAILTITVFLIVLLELSSYFIFELFKSRAENKFTLQDFNISYSENLSEIIKEDQQIKIDYAPYVGFEIQDIDGEYINVKDNKRVTINPCESKESAEIWFFGGSTAFGSFVRDEDTIPSIVSRILCNSNYSVKVVNYGQIGHTNTQEMIKYLLELKDGKKPKMAVFYTGFNDVFSANQNLKAGLPQNEFKRRLEFNSLERNNWSRIILNTYTMRIINKIIGRNNNLVGWLVVAPESEKDRLIKDIAQTYSNNFRFVDNISQAQNISIYFFFQPSVYTKKQRSILEEQYYALYKNHLNDMAVYNEIVNIIADELNNSRFINIINIYDNTNKTIFTDSIHKGKEGNEIEAEFMAEIIKQELEKHNKNK